MLRNIKCLRFEGDMMLLDMNDGTVKGWNTDDVSCMTFLRGENVNTSSIGVTNAVTFKFDGKRILLNSHYYLPVLLYTVDGKAVYCQPCCGESVIEMSEHSKRRNRIDFIARLCVISITDTSVWSNIGQRCYKQLFRWSIYG